MFAEISTNVWPIVDGEILPPSAQPEPPGDVPLSESPAESVQMREYGSED